VFDALVGGEHVVPQSGPDAGNLVCSHHGTNAGAAEEHCAIGLPSAHEVTSVECDVREVHGAGVGRATVDNLVAEACQDVEHVLFKHKPGMVIT
jgi:hypothetical protein